MPSKPRVEELGGKFRPETIEGKAARAKAFAEYQDRRQAVSPLLRGCRQIQESRRARDGGGLGQYRQPQDPVPGGLARETSGDLLWFSGWARRSASLSTSHYANSLDGAALVVETWDGHPEFTGAWTIDAKRLRKSSFTPDVDPAGEIVWTQSGRQPLTSEALADLIVTDQLEAVLTSRGERRL